jgi:hypothetical protein
MADQILNLKKTYLNNIISCGTKKRVEECNAEIQSFKKFNENLKTLESNGEAHEKLDTNTLEGFIKISHTDDFYKYIEKYSLWHVNKDKDNAISEQDSPPKEQPIILQLSNFLGEELDANIDSHIANIEKRISTDKKNLLSYYLISYATCFIGLLLGFNPIVMAMITAVLCLLSIFVGRHLTYIKADVMSDYLNRIQFSGADLVKIFDSIKNDIDDNLNSIFITNIREQNQKILKLSKSIDQNLSIDGFGSLGLVILLIVLMLTNEDIMDNINRASKYQSRP